MNILHKRLKGDGNLAKLSICYSCVIDSVKPLIMEVMDDETLDFISIMAKNKNMDGIKLFANEFFLEKVDSPIPRETQVINLTNYCRDKKYFINLTFCFYFRKKILIVLNSGDDNIDKDVGIMYENDQSLQKEIGHQNTNDEHLNFKEVN